MILSANLRAYRCKRQFEVIIALVIVVRSLQYYSITSIRSYKGHLLFNTQTHSQLSSLDTAYTAPN